MTLDASTFFFSFLFRNANALVIDRRTTILGTNIEAHSFASARSFFAPPRNSKLPFRVLTSAPVPNVAVISPVGSCGVIRFVMRGIVAGEVGQIRGDQKDSHRSIHGPFCSGVSVEVVTNGELVSEGLHRLDSFPEASAFLTVAMV